MMLSVVSDPCISLLTFFRRSFLIIETKITRYETLNRDPVGYLKYSAMPLTQEFLLHNENESSPR